MPETNATTPVSINSPGSEFKVFARLLRVKQWTKNSLLFAGLIFARQVLIWPQLEKVLLGFIVFCLLSSALYIINDSKDIENDRTHPRKKLRPIASGRIPVCDAVVIATILALVAFSLSFWLGPPFFVSCLGYATLTFTYTLWLKKLVIVDVMSIAAGFVIRAVAGALVINVPISPWFLLCVFLLALFLALVKRRQEVANTNGLSRQVLEFYPLPFLDQVIAVITAATLTGYFIYSFTAHSDWLMLTIPFVIYCIFRYLLLIYKEGAGEEPEQILLNDKPFILSLLIWLISSTIIIYLE